VFCVTCGVWVSIHVVFESEALLSVSDSLRVPVPVVAGIVFFRLTF